MTIDINTRFRAELYGASAHHWEPLPKSPTATIIGVWPARVLVWTTTTTLQTLRDFDALHSGPIVLSTEGAARFREMLASPAGPLPESPLPLDAFGPTGEGA